MYKIKSICGFGKFIRRGERENMKRKLIIVITLCLFLLGACSKPEAGNQENSLVGESTNSEQENMFSKDESEKDELDSNEEYEPKEEVLNAELGSGLIQIGNMIVRFPIKVSELTECTNAIYSSIGYKPDIMSNDFLLSKEDGTIIAGLFFEDANCSATYGSFVNKNIKAGDLIINDFRDIRSENIILPKGIRVGMSLEELQNMFGKSLDETMFQDGDVLCYSVDFLIEDDEAIEKCKECWRITRDKECDAGFYGNLGISIDRNTGLICEIMVVYGYSREFLN